MAVTTTPRIAPLVKRITASTLAHKFVADVDFWWSAKNNTVYYGPMRHLSDVWTLLHEIAHAELGHSVYDSDIELIRQEAAAWEHAKRLIAPRFDLDIATSHIEDALDTYRRWLHERSRCPECEQNGIQATQNTYNCINCRCSWRVNDARGCALRRVKLI